MNLENIQEWAQNILDDQGEVMPTFIAKADDGTQHMLAAPWRDDSDKARLLDFLRLYFMAYAIESYTLISEVWTSSQEKIYSPSADPNRREGLMILEVNRDGNAYSICEISRHGTLVKLGPPEEMRAGDGRMASLLPPKATTEVERRRAKEVLERTKEALEKSLRRLPRLALWLHAGLGLAPAPADQGAE